MLPSFGWGEMLVVVIAGLVILGPERLPGAITWTMGALRQVREYATGATDTLREELGTDFEEFREPLQHIQRLRGMSPTGLVTQHLLGGDDSLLTGDFTKKSASTDAAAAAASKPAAHLPATPGSGDQLASADKPQSLRKAKSLTVFDQDAT